MFSPTVIVVVLLVILLVVATIAAMRRVRTCPSDKILVKYGQVGGERMAKAIHGGTTFIVPVVQGFRYLDLTPMTVDIDLRGRVVEAEYPRQRAVPASLSASAPSRN